MKMDGQTLNPLQAGAAAITLDMARGALLGGGQGEERQVQPQQEQQTQAREPAPQATTEPQQDSAEQAEAAPAEERPSGEAQGDEPADLPPIDPPAFWSKEAKDKWSDVPRHVQEIILERERQRDHEVRRGQTDSAEDRKALQAEREAVQQERQLLQQRLNYFVPAAIKQFQDDFKDIKSPDDVLKMASEQPDRYAVFIARRDAIMTAQSAQQQLEAAQIEEAGKARDTHAKAEFAELVRKRPELKAPEKQKAWVGELTAYAVSQGVTREALSANDSHINLLILEKAMLFDRAKATLPDALKRDVPQVQRPGPARTKADQAEDARAAQMKRLDKSGSIDDALGLLRGR
jgi:hypothetical protein